MDKPLDLWCLLFHICYPFLCQYFCLFRLLQKTIHCFSVDNATHVGAKSSDNFAIITVITKAPCVLALMWVRVCAWVCAWGYISCHYPVYARSPANAVAYSKNIYLAVDKLPASTQLIQQMRVASWLRIRTSYPYTPCSVFRTPVLWVFRTFRTFPVTLQIRIPLPYFRCLARTSTGWLIFRCRCENSARNERVFGRWPTFIVSPPCFFCGVAVQFVVSLTGFWVYISKDGVYVKMSNKRGRYWHLCRFHKNIFSCINYKYVYSEKYF